MKSVGNIDENEIVFVENMYDDNEGFVSESHSSVQTRSRLDVATGSGSGSKRSGGEKNSWSWNSRDSLHFSTEMYSSDNENSDGTGSQNDESFHNNNSSRGYSDYDLSTNKSSTSSKVNLKTKNRRNIVNSNSESYSRDSRKSDDFSSRSEENN